MPFDLQDHARETMHRRLGFGKTLSGRLPFRLTPSCLSATILMGEDHIERERKAGADDQQYDEKQRCAVV
jgi:hypothetical protein